jgi:hypothetical protein
MALPPALVIDPPTVQPYAGGLYSAADFPALPGDGERWINGLVFQAETCSQPKSWAITCPEDVARETKTFEQTFPDLSGSAFVEYLGVQCALVGRTLEEYSTIVRRTLALCEQRAVERTFWTGDMGNDPHLADNDPVTGAVILSPTPLSLIDGVSELENALGDVYCGVGVLHAERKVAGYASNLFQAIGTPAKLTTNLGTKWAFGAGYSVNTGPDGVVAPDGEAWIYATAGIQIYRSDIWLQPDNLEQAFQTRTNFVELLAERAFVITMDCPVKYAVRVNLECSC